MLKTCLQCGTKFNVRGKRRKENAKFCSRNCQGKNQKGKSNTSTTKFKKGFIPWNKGKKTGNIPWNKGLSVSLSPKSQFKKGQTSPVKGRKLLHLRGENACHWKGGITPKNTLIRNSAEFGLWRKSVFTRDNFVCQKCLESGGYLHAHHINNFADFPELRLSIDNGITMCKKCHNNFHKKYMRKNNTREQLVEFFDGTNGAITLA